MAYNFLAESPVPIDWPRLVERLREMGPGVEAFPIPSADATGRDAIGLSLHGKGAHEEGSRQLESVLRVLLEEFLMDVIDLHRGRGVAFDDLAAIRAFAKS